MLPAWMKNFPGAPQPEAPDTKTDSEPTITPCRCAGEGCTVCDGDGAIYP